MSNFIADILHMDKFILRDGIYFSDNSAKVSFDDNEHNYLNDIEDKSWWFRHRNRCICATVKKFAKQGNFVEVGAGNGYVVSDIIKNRQMSAAAFEPGIQGALNCRKRGLEYVVCGLFDNETVKDGSVDNIGIFDVLEHIDREQEFLEQLHDTLTANGKLFITVPAHSFLWSASDAEAQHFRRYALRQLQAVVTRSHYIIEYNTFFFSALVPVILAFRRQTSGLYKRKGEFVPPGIIGNLAELIFMPEAIFIKHGLNNPFGASILLVAKKA